MATHTWVDLNIAEAATLADLHGVSWDLRNARDWAKELLAKMFAAPPNLLAIEPLSVAIAVMYSRPFVTGVRRPLGKADLAILTAEQRIAHDHLRAYRDKHVAHSVNAFEDNQPRAQYCIERVTAEGITSIGCGGARVLGMNSQDLNNVVELAEVMLKHVETRMADEQQRLLEIVRQMPLDQVLAGGQKSFKVNRGAKVHASRKR